MTLIKYQFMILFNKKHINTPKAFSVLELLLAIILTVLVVLSAAAAIRGLTRNRSAVEKFDTVFSQATFFMDSLARDLANTYSASDSNSPVINILINGSEQLPADRITFLRVTDPISADIPASVAEIEYGLTRYGDYKDSLARRVAPLGSDQTSNKGGKVFLLSDPVKSLKFEIYDGASWLRSAISTDSVPVMVRVTLDLGTTLWAQDSSLIVRQIPVYPCILKTNEQNKSDNN